jgi:hypothetical protein
VSHIRIVLLDGHVLSSRHAVWVGAWCTAFPLIISLYVNYMRTPSHHVEFALYTEVTAIIATSRKPTFLVSYLELYLNVFQRFLSE